MTRAGTRRRSSEGFTLFELAIVILIMGGMSVMVAPGLMQQMADARAAAAAEELVRLNRMIRARVNQTGLAHLLLFTATDDADGRNALGRVRVWEGMNNRCALTPWRWTINGKEEDGHHVLDGVDMGHSAYNQKVGDEDPAADDVGRQVVRIASSLGARGGVICFEPGGLTFTGVDDGSTDIGFTFTPQVAPVVFTVTRSVKEADGTVVVRGVPREIIFPASGNGRLRF